MIFKMPPRLVNEFVRRRSWFRRCSTPKKENAFCSILLEIGAKRLQRPLGPQHLGSVTGIAGRRRYSSNTVSVKGEFQVLRQELDGVGGGSLLFEVVDPRRPSSKLRAETVVVAFRQSAWKTARVLPGRGATVCVSSQAGCALDCVFCDTGRVRPVGNLPAWAIVEQVYAAQKINPDVQRVVFMGMGEPLLNYSEVSKAILDLQSSKQLPYLSRPWALTVSTVGVIPRIPRLATDHPKVGLTLSLHAPNQTLRKKLLPSSAERWPLGDVLQATWSHAGSVGRAPMFAYIVLPGMNDSEGHASELATLLTDQNLSAGKMRPFVNLIPYNATQAGDLHGFLTPSREHLQTFRTMLRARGVRATVRWSTTEGRPIVAACGQLTGKPDAHDSTVVVDVAHPSQTTAEPVQPLTSEGMSPAALTRALHSAASMDHVLELVRIHGTEFNSIHASAAFVTLARSAKEGSGSLHNDERLHALKRVTLSLLPTLGAQACANVLWSMGKLRHHPGDQFWQALESASLMQLKQFWPQNLANCLWACAVLQISASSALVNNLVGEAGDKAQLLTPFELSNSLWAVAKINCVPGEIFMAAWTETAIRKASFFKGQDTVKSLWACSVLCPKTSHSALLDALVGDDGAHLPVPLKTKQKMAIHRACVKLDYGGIIAIAEGSEADATQDVTMRC